jgi:hypothetical protein
MRSRNSQTPSNFGNRPNLGSERIHRGREHIYANQIRQLDSQQERFYGWPRLVSLPFPSFRHLYKC